MSSVPGGEAAAPGAVDVIDEAIHLMRLAPAGALASFYAGSVPFVLGFLYFWSDMSRDPFAGRRVVEGSLGVALLYVWMKAWQAVFARGLRARISGHDAPRLPFAERAGLLMTQAAMQPTSLFVLPVASLLLLPYGWAYAFYQNLSVTGDARSARRQALLWPRQNHAIICIMALLACFVFLNVVMTIALVPYLFKTLFGIETVISASPASLLNTTLFLTACGLTYLATAPLAKAVYVVRCFHGDSLLTGEDLRAELRAVTPWSRRAAAILVVALALGAGPGAAAAAGPKEPARARAATLRIPPGDIDRAVREVAARREFAWRLPRVPQPGVEKGLVARFFDEVAGITMDALRSIYRSIARLVGRMARLWSARDRSASERRDGLEWVTSVQGLLAVLLAAVACAAVLFFWRSRQKRMAPDATPAEAVPAIPDVSVDASAAAETPTDSWLERARELARQGDLRQAVRALYLGCLSHLASRELVILARFKSNRDYQGELRRRGRARPELAALFAENVALFERVWYGRHEATEEMLRRSTTNLERMRFRAYE